MLFKDYYASLVMYAMHYVRQEVAEDIVQDCFVNLWNSKRLHSFSGDLDRFIFKMVKNQAFLFLREYKKRYNIQVSFSQESEISHYDTLDESSKEIELLYQTIDKLPEKCRKVFLMACLNDKTYQEVADELGTSINTVKTQMKTALKFLRENLQEELFFTLLLFFNRKRLISYHPFSSF